MPDPKGRDAQVINSPNNPLEALVRELQVTRLDNTLVEIVYNYTTSNFKQHLTIQKQDGMMRITQHYVVL